MHIIHTVCHTRYDSVRDFVTWILVAFSYFCVVVSSHHIIRADVKDLFQQGFVLRAKDSIKDPVSECIDVEEESSSPGPSLIMAGSPTAASVTVSDETEHRPRDNLQGQVCLDKHSVIIEQKCEE